MARCQLSLAAVISAVLVANATGQTPQQVDLRALTVLSNALAATGWTAAQLPTDAVVTGEYVRISEGVERTFPATFEIKGTRRFKMTSEPGISLTLNDKQAVVQSSEGAWEIPPHSALSMRPLPLPMFTEIPSVSAAAFEIQYLGADVVEGESCDQLLIQPTLDPILGEDDLGRRAGRLKVWISQKTNLPVKMEYVRLADSNPGVTLEHTVRFSDYRITGAILVPFQLEESVLGRLLYKFRITSVQFNVGLLDSDFDIAQSQGTN